MLACRTNLHFWTAGWPLVGLRLPFDPSVWMSHSTGHVVQTEEALFAVAGRPSNQDPFLVTTVEVLLDKQDERLPNILNVAASNYQWMSARQAMNGSRSIIPNSIIAWIDVFVKGSKYPVGGYVVCDN